MLLSASVMASPVVWDHYFTFASLLVFVILELGLRSASGKLATLALAIFVYPWPAYTLALHPSFSQDVWGAAISRNALFVASLLVIASGWLADEGGSPRKIAAAQNGQSDLVGPAPGLNLCSLLMHRIGDHPLLGFRPVRPNARRAADSILGHRHRYRNSPIARHCSALGLTSSQRLWTRSAGRSATKPSSCAMSWARTPVTGWSARNTRAPSSTGGQIGHRVQVVHSDAAVHDRSTLEARHRVSPSR